MAQAGRPAVLLPRATTPAWPGRSARKEAQGWAGGQEHQRRLARRESSRAGGQKGPGRTRKKRLELGPRVPPRRMTSRNWKGPGGPEGRGRSRPKEPSRAGQKRVWGALESGGRNRPAETGAGPDDVQELNALRLVTVYCNSCNRSLAQFTDAQKVLLVSFSPNLYLSTRES